MTDEKKKPEPSPKKSEEPAPTPAPAKQTDPQAATKPRMDPVRKWTFGVLATCVVLMAWYLVSDRVTPYTSQARVHALVVPIASEVSGTVVEVAVGTNQFVEAGDVLFRIDPSRYQLAVETAQANLEAARQATGASEANVGVARAAVGSAEAGLIRAQQDAERLRRIKKEDPGAISDRRVESAEASLLVAQGQVEAAKAGLEMAIQQAGREGDDNSAILQAQSALDQASIDLARAIVVAPDNGLVTDVRVDRGNFAQAGAPNMTFIAIKDVWVQADFTENNLGNIKAGDPVRIVFDALPGRVYEGNVRGSGFGVAVDSAPLGSLPTIDNNRQWLRSAQRFPVVIDFSLNKPEEPLGLRVGAQASVMVYTGDGQLFNRLGRWYMWAVSKFTYLY